MKIFMDTANVDEIKQYVDWGVVYGVTTNPVSYTHLTLPTICSV